MHYVYILTSIERPDRIYIGLTNSVNRRLEEHNYSKVCFTRSFAPWKLETYVAFSSYALAKEFEDYLKRGSGFAFMKKRLLPK